MKTAEYIENQFIEQVTITLAELSRVADVSVRTLQRIIKKLKTIRSYDHNGRFFSLEEIAIFNPSGIWEYNNIHFSRFGNLKNTLIAIISNSETGMNASQIRDTLGMDTRSFLSQYKDVKGVRREKIGNNYVYFSANQEQFEGQLSKRTQQLEPLGQSPLKGPTAIRVLVTLIKNPDLTIERLSDYLHKEGIRIKPETIKGFFEFYGIEKKTGLV